MGIGVYVTLLILLFWILYEISVFIISGKKEWVNILVICLFLILFITLIIIGKQEDVIYQYGSYGLYVVIMINYVVVGLRKHLNSDVSDEEFYEMEEKIKDLSYDSELLRQRFISTIEIMNDGIAFRESDGSIFGTDLYVKYIGLKDNVFTVQDFEKLVVKEDLIHYNNILENTSNKNPIYKVDYRVRKGTDFVWIKEVGKRIVLEKKVSYISTVKRMDIKQFPETEIDVLNGMPGYKNMYDEMQRLVRNKIPYNLVVIQLTNIPRINDKFGRDVGDLMMGEYLKKFRFNFIKDNNSLFRVSGITFGVLIKDNKKMDFLERALTGGGELMNLDMVFGGITQTLYPNLGISESPYKGKTPDIMIEEALKALNVSLKDQSNQNYCYYDKL